MMIHLSRCFIKKVDFRRLGKIGYVANSPYTVVGDSMSAGRMYQLRNLICKRRGYHEE
jgi:hypothetical protein